MNRLIHPVLLSAFTGLSVLTSIAAHSAPIQEVVVTLPGGKIEAEVCKVLPDGTLICWDKPKENPPEEAENPTETQETAPSGNFSR